MPDPVAGSPGTAPSTNPSPEPSPAGNAAPGTAPTDPASTTAPTDRIDRIERTVNSLAAQLRRGTTTPTPAPAAAAGTPGTVEEQLRAVQAEVRTDREALAAERRETQIDSAIATLKLDADNTELLRAFVLTKHGAAITLDGKKVIHTDPVTGDVKPIGTFITDLVKGSFGDRFRPANTSPSSPSLRSGNAPAPGQPKKFTEMSSDERLTLKAKDPKAYYDLIKAEEQSQ